MTLHLGQRVKKGYKGEINLDALDQFFVSSDNSRNQPLQFNEEWLLMPGERS